MITYEETTNANEILLKWGTGRDYQYVARLLLLLEDRKELQEEIKLLEMSV